MQSRKQALCEVLTNTAIGFVGALIITWLSFSFVKNIELASFASTAACTVWSIARGYAIRRYFNRRQA